jgi:hypothetical protein
MKKISLNLNAFPLWSEIYWIEYEINNSIYALRKMITFQDESFESISKDLTNKILKLEFENQNMNKADLESYRSHIFGLDEQILIDLKRIQDFNKIISIYSMTESKLKSTSIKIEAEFNTNFDLSKSNSVFLKNWKFFRCFLEEKIVLVEKYFTPIINQIEIRNIINHQDGIATSTQYKGLSDIKGITFVKSKDMYYITLIDEIFINNLLDKIEIFFEALLNAIKIKTNELKK